MHPAIVIVTAIAAGIALALTIRVVVRSVARRALKAASHDPALVGVIWSTTANMPGGQRASGSRVGGVGILAVTRADVRFVLATPRRVTTISREQLHSVQVESAVKVPGRYRRGLRPVVVIRWSDRQHDRVAAFMVRDAASVVAAIERNLTLRP